MYLLINSHTNKENFNKTLNRIQFFQKSIFKILFSDFAKNICNSQKCAKLK